MSSFSSRNAGLENESGCRSAQRVSTIWRGSMSASPTWSLRRSFSAESRFTSSLSVCATEIRRDNMPIPVLAWEGFSSLGVSAKSPAASSCPGILNAMPWPFFGVAMSASDLPAPVRLDLLLDQVHETIVGFECTLEGPGRGVVPARVIDGPEPLAGRPDGLHLWDLYRKAPLCVGGLDPLANNRRRLPGVLFRGGVLDLRQQHIDERKVFARTPRSEVIREVLEQIPELSARCEIEVVRGERHD